MIFYLGCDGNGINPIRKYLDNPNFKHLPITHYKDFDTICRDLTTDAKSDDTVIIDTITMLTLTMKGDLNFGEDVDTLWQHREKFFAEKRGFGMVTAPTEMILRHLRNISRNGTGAKIIVTAHETEKKDKLTGDELKRSGPDLTPQFRGLLIGCSSDVIRLGVYRDDVTNSVGKVIASKGDRVAYLEDSDDYIVKFIHPEGVKRKTKLINPTYASLCEYAGGIPSWLTIYAPAGTGKTTLAASALLMNKDK